MALSSQLKGSIMTWFKFCPNCGKTDLKSQGDNAQICQGCGFIHYFNPAPTVAALIVKDGQLLLGKRAKEPHQGAWDLPGGFIDPGETIEQALLREISEELKVQINLDRYLASFPDVYGKSGINTVNIYFVCSLVSGQPQPGDDVVECRWFPLNNLPTNIEFECNRQAINYYLKEAV